jgi:hypothetical protein
MDPVSYRIEPLILNYPKTDCSFILPHWKNDGVNKIHNIMQIFFCEKPKTEKEDPNDLNRKRYDFMVQEYPSERAVNIIGFMFSHMAYWNNPDVFYFVIKTINGQGYQKPKIIK